MTTPMPDPYRDDDLASQILEDFFAGPDSDWTPEELIDARRAVSLDDEERDR